MIPLAGKKLIIGVTGSIAAYKAALLARECVKGGAEVRVVMTPSAAAFIAPLTLSTLSRNDAVIDMFPTDRASGTWHIDLALWADAMMIAPASANTIAKLAHGFADNALTALALALRGPLLVAPAMDMDMYDHPATQDNLAILRRRGVTIIAPEEGDLASGLSGPGRLADIPVLLDALAGACAPARKDFAGISVLVSAGPTHEPIDPVRFIGNRSSGKMGFAIAAAAADRGADVTLVSGPSSLHTPAGVTRIDVDTAAEMHRAITEHAAAARVIVMAAAVADFRPAHPAEQKLKKDALGADGWTLALVRTPDILSELGASRRPGQVLVGFALETDSGEQNALDKMRAKHADLMVLNNPRDSGAGFGTDTNLVRVFSAAGGREDLPLLPKRELADILLDRVSERLGIDAA